MNKTQSNNKARAQEKAYWRKVDAAKNALRKLEWPEVVEVLEEILTTTQKQDLGESWYDMDAEYRREQ